MLLHRETVAAARSQHPSWVIAANNLKRLLIAALIQYTFPPNIFTYSAFPHPSVSLFFSTHNTLLTTVPSLAAPLTGSSTDYGWVGFFAFSFLQVDHIMPSGCQGKQAPSGDWLGSCLLGFYIGLVIMVSENFLAICTMQSLVVNNYCLHLLRQCRSYIIAGNFPSLE